MSKNNDKQCKCKNCQGWSSGGEDKKSGGEKKKCDK